MKMRKHASFGAYAAAQSPAKRALIGALRRFVKRTDPGLVESVKWGNGCWLRGGVPVCYVYAGYAGLVQFGFFAGARLRDPLALLQGKGKSVRFIPLRRAADLDRKAFAALLKQAL